MRPPALLRSQRSLLSWLLLICLGVASGCAAPSYTRQVGEQGQIEAAQSVSLEGADYTALVTRFAQELTESSLYEAELRRTPARPRPAAIANKELKVDISDLGTKPDLLEQRLRIELQRAGIRYISEQERQAMIERLKLQNSDLNDPETRGRFGRFANAKYYLVGRLYEVQHYTGQRSKKREFYLLVELLDVETLESVFASEILLTKRMQG
jgi:hypothetical protein